MFKSAAQGQKGDSRRRRSTKEERRRRGKGKEAGQTANVFHAHSSAELFDGAYDEIDAIWLD